MKGGERPTVGVARGMSWGHPTKGRTRTAAATLAAAGLLLMAAPAPPSSAADAPMVDVIVRETPGRGDAAEDGVRRLGGRVGRHIGIIDGFVARIPATRAGSLRTVPGIRSATPDAAVRLLGARFDPATDPGSMYSVTHQVIGAAEFWARGYTGQGVDVAMIDSGVVPVNGLTAHGKVINGADLSFESQAENLRYLDTFGHGTHMAGIIAGRDDTVTPPAAASPSQFVGIAPNARVLNVKVADANGATDVSQVIAAIDWVVQHRKDPGMNVRILNLSFGTDGLQSHALDPLTYAVEVAWAKGLVVVVAAGNQGYGSPKMNNPAYAPDVIAVGAADSKGTSSTGDDTIPGFSSCGNLGRHPDLVAPGKSIVSLRAPSSNIDLMYPGGRERDRFFRGSGTSQAAAVASGAAALLLSQRPHLSPEQVKTLLTSTASEIPGADSVCQGAGMIDLGAARTASTPLVIRQNTQSSGQGSIEEARGTAHVVDGDEALTGERDIFRVPWSGATWSVTSLSGSSWSGGTWRGTEWSGRSWTGTSWAGPSWAATVWSGPSWSGRSWSDPSWSGKSWSGKSWSGEGWTGKSWSGKSWGGAAWSTASWG
jgi:subtilisin family serine protease